MGETSVASLKNLAHRIRIHSVTSTSAAKSGHPTTCSSCAEILSVLFFKVMKYKTCSPLDPSNDRFVLSKGHAAPALYGCWVELGHVKASDLKNLRDIKSDLEGHPTPRLKFIDVGTGSLGQGLSIANGMAYIGKFIDEAPYRVYCLIGDGECAEGSIWESINFASHYKLDNLVLIIDVNRMGQTGNTMFGHDLTQYEKRLTACNFNCMTVDGHNVEELIKAFQCAESCKGKPSCVIAKTFKGKDFPEIEDKENWHGKPLGDKTDAVLQHLQTLMTNGGEAKFSVSPPDTPVDAIDLSGIKLASPPSYKKGEKVATRNAYGNALVKLAKSNPRVMAFDGDMRNSTFSEYLMKESPKNFVECYIAEQNMVGVAIGAACRNRACSFASTFAAFLTRAFDQIRMAAISQSNVNICGSHCGISIGHDGPSQMALEDIAMFRTIPTCTLFYPSDAVATERATELASNCKGITYIRTTRSPTPVFYENDQKFELITSGVQWYQKVNFAFFVDAALLLMRTVLGVREKIDQHALWNRHFVPDDYVHPMAGVLKPECPELPKQKKIYGVSAFRIGKGVIVQSTTCDKILVICACITLEETLKASKTLHESGTNVRIMDPFTIKPIDRSGIIQHANEVGGKVLVVEDHYAEGGIGEAVLSAIQDQKNIVVKIAAVTGTPRSGDTPDVLKLHAIDAESIVSHVKSLLKG